MIVLAYWMFLARTNQDIDSQGSMFSDQVEEDTDKAENISGYEVFNFADIRAKESLFTRRLAMYDLVDKADEEMLEQLFDRATQMPTGAFRREIEKAVVRKWATVSPQNVLKHIEGVVMLRYRELLSLVFKEWVRLDLDEAISHAIRFGSVTRQIIFDCIRDSLRDMDVNDLMSIAQKLDIEFYARQKIFQELAESEIDDPMEVWTQFVAENRNRFQLLNQYKRNYLMAVARAIGDRGVDALYEASALLTNINDRMIVLPTIVYQVAQNDPQAALNFALAEVRDMTGMTWGVVSVWADSDPRAALTAVSEIEDLDLRIRLQRTVFDRWSAKDAISVLKELNNLPEGSRQLAEEIARVAVAEHSPEQATKWLQDIEDPNLRANVASQIAISWAKRNAAAALNWIESEHSLESIKDSLVRDVVRAVTLTDPQWALDTALEHSVPTDAIGLEAEILAEIARRDPDTALKLLPVARNEATKLAGLLSIGSHLVGRTHDSHDRAIELAEELSSDEDKNRYLSLLMFDFEYEDLYSMIDQFPTSDLREQAANLLLDNDKQNLSASQIEKLQTYQKKSE